MDRLSIFLTLATGAVLTGGAVILVMSFGFYNWWAIGGAALAGFLLSWPAAYAVSRRIKRQDPAFDHTRKDDVGYVPSPAAHEV